MGLETLVLRYPSAVSMSKAAHLHHFPLDFLAPVTHVLTDLVIKIMT